MGCLAQTYYEQVFRKSASVHATRYDTARVTDQNVRSIRERLSFPPHSNPYSTNFFLVSARVPGGERKTIWSSVEVDGVPVIAWAARSSDPNRAL